jgi:hypothetical protein
MTYNDAESTVRQIEDAFPDKEVRLVSLPPKVENGDRDYGASIELTFPMDLKEFAKLEAIAPEKTGRVTTTEAGLRIHLL